MYMWGAGEEYLTEEGLKFKLQTLHDENGVRDRVRTYFRKIVLNELLSGPGARPTTSVTITARAVGSLFIEWLKAYNCHYTISMLTSEMPSLSDLPQLHNPDPAAKYQVDDVIEILNALQLDKEEIAELYGTSSVTLLASILETARKWCQRLSFKFSHCISHDEEDDKKWCRNLREILSAASVSPNQLPRLHESIKGLLTKIVNDAVQRERESFNNELLLREKLLQKHMKAHENKLESKLNELEHGFLEMDRYDSDQVNESKDILYKLLVEVREQHQVVLDALNNLEEQEIDLERERREWKDMVAEERRILEERSDALAMKAIQLSEEKIKISSTLQQIQNLKSKLGEKIQSDKSVQTDEDPPMVAERKTFVSKRHSGIPKPIFHKQKLKEIIPEDVLPITDSISSDVNEAHEALTIASERLKELKEEGRQAKEDYYLFCKGSGDIDDSSSATDSQPVNACMPNRQNSFGPSKSPRHGSKTQASFPNRRAGAHPGAEVSRRHRYVRFCGQEDQGTTSFPDTIKISDKSTPFLDSVVDKQNDNRGLLRVDFSTGAQKVEQIIQSVRTEAPPETVMALNPLSNINMLMLMRSPLRHIVPQLYAEEIKRSELADTKKPDVVFGSNFAPEKNQKSRNITNTVFNDTEKPDIATSSNLVPEKIHESRTTGSDVFIDTEEPDTAKNEESGERPVDLPVPSDEVFWRTREENVPCLVRQATILSDDSDISEGQVISVGSSFSKEDFFR